MINPFRAVSVTLVCLLLLAFVAFVGLMVYSAIVDGWWLKALKIISVIAAFIALVVVCENWRAWETAWDQKHRSSSAGD